MINPLALWTLESKLLLSELDRSTFFTMVVVPTPEMWNYDITGDLAWFNFRLITRLYVRQIIVD